MIEPSILFLFEQLSSGSIRLLFLYILAKLIALLFSFRFDLGLTPGRGKGEEQD